MDQPQQTGMPVSQPAGGGKKPLIIGVIVVILLVGGYFLLRGGSTPATDNQGIVAGDQNSITVGDQDADSVAVLLSDVQLRQPGFVAIHSDLNGSAGPIVSSSSLLQPGDHKNVSVTTKTTPGAYYWAMLHADDGNGLFDAANDKPTTDNSGNNVVMVRFMVKLTSVGGEQKG